MVTQHFFDGLIFENKAIHISIIILQLYCELNLYILKCIKIFIMCLIFKFCRSSSSSSNNDNYYYYYY